MNPSRMAAVSLWVCLFWLEAVRLASADAPAHPPTVSHGGSDSQYVVFTLGGLEDVHDPAPETPFKQRLSRLVEELKETFHRTQNDVSRFVGFSPGLTRVQNLPAPELEARVVAALDVAEETDMPVFFHLDDMHFCYDRTDLFSDGESAEWSAFPKPGETHGPIVERYWLNWGQWVVFPAPVPCFESPEFREDVANRMRKRVAQPLVARLEAWRLQGREYLFAGIAVGNETQVPDYRGVLKGSPDGRIEGIDVTQRPPRKVQMEPREMTRAGYHALQLRRHTQASIESLAKEQGRDVQEVITTLLDDVAADYSAFRCRLLREAADPPSSDATAPPPVADVLTTPARPVQLGKIPATAEIVYHQNGHIYVMDSKGEGATQITFGERRPWEHAAVSYDRRYVVGNANTPHPKGGHRSELWLFDLEKGTEARLLPGFDSAGGGGVDWDPNGFIYFAAIEKRPAPSRDFPRDMALADDIYRIRLDGTGLKRLTHDTEVAEADVAVAEDGRLVVYAAAAGMGTPEQRAEIWVMNADGTNQRRVHRGGPIGAEDEGAHDPELSPDNRQVVFSKVNHKVPPNWPHIPGLNTAHDLYVANLDGTGLRRLTRPGSISIIPDWQGERLVFDERSEKDNYQGASIVSASGTDQTPRRIKPGVRMPKWIPVATASARSQATDADGGHQEWASGGLCR